MVDVNISICCFAVAALRLHRRFVDAVAAAISALSLPAEECRYATPVCRHAITPPLRHTPSRHYAAARRRHEPRVSFATIASVYTREYTLIMAPARLAAAFSPLPLMLPTPCMPLSLDAASVAFAAITAIRHSPRATADVITPRHHAAAISFAAMMPRHAIFRHAALLPPASLTASIWREERCHDMPCFSLFSRAFIMLRRRDAAATLRR